MTERFLLPPSRDFFQPIEVAPMPFEIEHEKLGQRRIAFAVWNRKSKKKANEAGLLEYVKYLSDLKNGKRFSDALHHCGIMFNWNDEIIEIVALFSFDRIQLSSGKNARSKFKLNSHFQKAPSGFQASFQTTFRKSLRQICWKDVSTLQTRSFDKQLECSSRQTCLLKFTLKSATVALFYREREDSSGTEAAAHEEQVGRKSDARQCCSLQLRQVALSGYSVFLTFTAKLFIFWKSLELFKFFF